MRSNVARVVAAVAASATGLAIGLLITAPAEAALLGPPTSLTLTVSHDGEEVLTTLRCHPAGGRHARAESACAALTRANGDFRRLNENPDRACTLHLDPVEVTAHGTWRHRPVMYRHTYGNPCELAVTTGAVFSF